MLRVFLLAVAWLACAAAVHADPGYYVVTPYDKAGLRTLELRYWTVKRPGRPEVIWPELGAGYGINSRWTSTVFVSWIGSSQSATRQSSLNWQNNILLTQGEWPVDVALHLQFIRDQIRSDRRSIEFGPVLQTDFGRTQVNGNLFFESFQGAARTEPTQLKYQWQVRHRWLAGVHVGAQGFGEVGPWDAWAGRNRQSHRAGPALFGTLRFEDKRALHVQAAWLEGDVSARRSRMFTLRANYDF
jgi:hypothetical protein